MPYLSVNELPYHSVLSQPWLVQSKLQSLIFSWWSKNLSLRRGGGGGGYYQFLS
jgi:hypothetical protein